MNRETNIEQFEELMSAIERPGIDKLMDYIRKSDFYTAPASTKFHLSCKGGLLQHSLNVYEAMKHRLEMEGVVSFIKLQTIPLRKLMRIHSRS